MALSFTLTLKLKGLLVFAGLLSAVGLGLLFPNVASAYGNTLYPGESLRNGAALTSANQQFVTVMQSDGNLVAQMWPKPYWALGTYAPNSVLIMQGDGNLVLYRVNSANVIYGVAWASNTFDTAGARLVLQDDGNLVIVGNSKGVLKGFGAVPTKLHSGQKLIGYKNHTIYSPDRRFRMVMQSDGNLVVYRTDGGIEWASNHTNRVPGSTLNLQSDGNLVIYTPGPIINPLWATNKYGPDGSYLEAQNDGNFVVYSPSRQKIWASKDSVPVSSDVAQLARQILDLRNAGKISIGNRGSFNIPSDTADRSLANLQLEDLAAGKQANLSTRKCDYTMPASPISPDVRILQFLADLGQQYHYDINSLFGQCHSPASNHHKGKAVDFGCGFSTTIPDAVGRKYGISHNSENCTVIGKMHYHYSIGGN